MHDLTVLVLVPDAKDKLRRGLDSVAWADAIFCVVDSRTSDGSAEIAREMATRVETREFINDANQRNWAIPQITTEWTLVLDADEWLSGELSDKIQMIIREDGEIDGYEIRRRSFFFGKLINHCGWHHDYNWRLFRTGKGRYIEQRVHSRVVIDGPKGSIHEHMYHDTYRTFEEYFATAQRYSRPGAEDYFERGRRAHLSDLTLRPLLRWVKMYIIRHGFMDGYHGAVLCALSSCSVFLKYAKLWNLERLEKLDGDNLQLSEK